MSDYVFTMHDPISGLDAALEAEAAPRPLRVSSRRQAFGVLAWFAWCQVCDREVRPYTPLSGWTAGVMVTIEGVRFSTAAAAGDEARTHLMQRHPTHPLVR